MPPLPRLLEYTDYFLLCGGALFSLIVIARLMLRRRIGSALALPSPDAITSGGGTIDPFDTAAAFLAMFVLPSMFNSALSIVMWAADIPVADSPTTVGGNAATDAAPHALPTLQLTIAMTLGQCITLLVFVVIVRRCLDGGLASWGIRLRTVGRDFGVSVVAFFCIWPWCFGLMYASMLALTWLWPDYSLREHDTIRLLMDPNRSAMLRYLTFFNALVLASTVEECFFRGMLLPMLAKFIGRTWPAVILTGIVFGVFHYPLYQTFAPLALLGIVLGYAYARSGSLLLPICLHMVFNAKTLIWIALGAGIDAAV